MSSWREVCTVENIRSNKCVEVNGKKIALFKIEKNIYALDDRCSHEEAALSEGDIEDHTVYCPLHYAQFDLATGKPLTLPATEHVRTYPVKIEDDKVLLKISI